MSLDFTVIGKRALVAATALFSLSAVFTLSGCTDQLLPVEPVITNPVPAKIVFSEITHISGTEYSAAFARIEADGSGRIELTDGVLTAPPGAAGAAVIRADRGIWLTPVSGSSPAAPQLVASSTQHPSAPGSMDGHSVATAPDGTRVTYTTYADRTTTIAGIGGSFPVILPRGVAPESTPSFSPDGSRLAFFSADSNWIGSPGGLYVVNVDGTNLRLIERSDGIIHNGQSSIDWSPSGDRLGYVDDNTEIRVIGVDGSGGRTIAAGAHPVWNPAGDSILYTHASLTADLFLVGADGSGTARQITDTPALVEMYPRFSPDGKQILYTSYAGKIDEAPGHLTVMDFATGATKVLSTNHVSRGFWLK